MKPIYLKMQAFGPYAGTQVVDFRLLGDRNFFLIYGPTGAGKTTILDAICYSLYNTTSGNSRSGAHMRSEYASPEEPTSVSFSFIIGTKRYRVERSPEQQVAKKRGTGLRKAPATAALYEIDDDGADVRVIATKNVTAYVEELLGFQAEQFRQVVLLPQGDFRRLLLANSSERQQIMQILFHTQRYAKLQDLAKEKHDAVQEQYSSLNERISLCLQGIGADSEERLLQLEQTLQQQQAQAAASAQAAAADRDACQQAVQAAQVLYSHWQALKASCQQAAQLEQKRETYEQKRVYIQKLRQAQVLAEPCRRLDEVQEHGTVVGKNASQAEAQAEQLRQRLTAAAAEERALQEQLPRRQAEREQVVVLQGWAEKAQHYTAVCQAAAQAKAAAEKAASALNQAAQQRDELQKQLDASRRVLENQPALAAALEQAKARLAAVQERLRQEQHLENIQQAVHQAESECRKARTVWQAAEEKARQDRVRYDAVQFMFLQNQSALLASDLEDGQPCPVCGSVAHPKLAVPAEKMPRKEDVEQCQQQAQSSDRARQEAEIAVKQAETRIGAKKQEYEGLRQQYPEDGSVQQWQERSDQAEKKAAVLGKQLAQAEELRRRAAGWEEAKAALTAREESLRRQSDQARLQAAQKQAEQTQIEADLPENYRKPGRAAAEMAKLQQSLKEYDGKTESLRRQLGDMEKEEARWSEQAKLLQAQVAALRDEYTALCESVKVQIGQSALTSVKECRQLQPFISTLDAEQAAVDAYDRDVQQVQGRIAQEEQAVGSQAEPQMDMYTKTLAEKNEQCRKLSEAAAHAALQVQQAQTARKQIAGWHARQEELTEQYKTVGALYELIAGKQTGINFERYVLGALLDEVLHAANIRLDEMSRRRYALQRSQSWDDKRVRQIGLDIEVFDNYTGYARPANTLSGGETFLASLALALGLADVVQAYSGGIHLDTMFIDEGFGTLDGETLDFALKALLELKQSGRLLGIISHVPELRDRIDTRLAIRKTDRGSTASFELL